VTPADRIAALEAELANQRRHNALLEGTLRQEREQRKASQAAHARMQADVERAGKRADFYQERAAAGLEALEDVAKAVCRSSLPIAEQQPLLARIGEAQEKHGEAGRAFMARLHAAEAGAAAMRDQCADYVLRHGCAMSREGESCMQLTATALRGLPIESDAGRAIAERVPLLEAAIEAARPFANLSACFRDALAALDEKGGEG